MRGNVRFLGVLLSLLVVSCGSDSDNKSESNADSDEKTSADAEPDKSEGDEAKPDAAAAMETATTKHGDACKDPMGDSDCSGDAPACVKRDSKVTECATADDCYCTSTMCDVAKDNCPDGFSCVDLSMFAPGLVPTCLRDTPKPAGPKHGDFCMDLMGDTDCAGGAAPDCVRKDSKVMSCATAADCYCTNNDCDVATDNCPDGFTCVDLSMFSPGLPKRCLRD